MQVRVLPFRLRLSGNQNRVCGLARKVVDEPFNYLGVEKRSSRSPWKGETVGSNPTTLTKLAL